jgi:hypothetical protein
MQILEVIRVFLLTRTKTLTLTGQSAAIKTPDSGTSSSQRASSSKERVFTLQMQQDPKTTLYMCEAL